MIRSFSLAVATIAVVAVTPAQAQKQFVGITGGATVGDFGSVSSNSRWGGTAGITLGYRNFNWSVVNIEGLWVQRGAEGLRLDYIEVPLLIGGVARVGSSGDFRSRFYGGIQVAFKINCSASTSGPSLAPSCATANSTVWGLPFGVQLGRWKPNGSFVALDVRYMLGLSNAFSTSNAYNRGWMFKLVFGKSIGR
jgi:Outer membrane protein beta-barrel domain